MPWRNLDATILIESPPEVEVHDGLFWVIDRVGSSTIKRVYLPHTFARIVRAAQNALDKFHACHGDNVVSLKDGTK